jgi:predicted peptidase
MIMKRAWLIGAGALVLAGFAAGAEAEDGKQEAKSFEKEVTTTVKLNYLLYLPEGYEGSTEKYPLVLFLHGAGESGNDLEKVKVHGPPKRVAGGTQFPFVLVSPQAPEFGWKPEVLAALLDEVVATNRIDEDRVYVTGMSMGGAGTFALVAHQPERFAAAAPVCGFVRGGDAAKVAEKSKGVPFWIFHGAKDRVVPVAASRDMKEALGKAGAEVKYTEYPEADHDSWTETYENPEFYEWLLAQKRKGAE